jgi:hypothetical protein
VKVENQGNSFECVRALADPLNRDALQEGTLYASIAGRGHPGASLLYMAGSNMLDLHTNPVQRGSSRASLYPRRESLRSDIPTTLDKGDCIRDAIVDMLRITQNDFGKPMQLF